MNNIKLKDVLQLSDIVKGIKLNLLPNEYVSAILDTLKSEKENSISVIVNKDGCECDFENTLHADFDEKVFLLESRLFKRADGSMVNSYLELLDENLNIIEGCVDDVWSYADFKEVEDFKADYILDSIKNILGEDSIGWRRIEKDLYVLNKIKDWLNKNEEHIEVLNKIKELESINL